MADMRIYVATNKRGTIEEIRHWGYQAELEAWPLRLYSTPSIKKYSDILKRFDSILRFECIDMPLPPGFWRSFLDAWSKNNFYLKCTGRHLLLDGLTVEIFGRKALEAAAGQRYPFLPDGSLNTFGDKRSQPYWFDMDQQRFYLLENYDTFYARPRSLCIEVTPMCNLRCTKCQFHSLRSPYTAKANRRLPGSPMMAMKEWKRIIDMAGGFSRNLSVSPAIRGECLLHKDIVDMVAYAAGRGHDVSFYTNGNLLNKELSKALVGAGLRSIAFSLDAVDKEKYNRLQPGGDFNRVLGNIEDLLRIRGKRKIPRIEVSFCESPANEMDFKKYLKFWEDRVDRVTASIELDINKKHIPWKTYYKVPFRYPCVWLWGAMYIHSNGNAAACGLDIFQQHQLGNVFEKGILPIWNGDAYMGLRRNQAQRERRLGFCQGDISWTNPYSVEIIEGDNYRSIGPMIYAAWRYKPGPRLGNLKPKIKKAMRDLKIPAVVMRGLRNLYLRVTQ